MMGAWKILVFATFSFAPFTTCLPSDTPWLCPCAGATLIGSLSTESPETVHCTQTAQTLLHVSSLAQFERMKNISRELTHRFFVRLSLNERHPIICSLNNSHVPGFNPEISQDESICERLRTDYHQLSVAYVFIEEVNETDDDGYGKVLLRQLMTSILQALCAIDQVLEGDRHVTVTRDVMRNSDRNVSSVPRRFFRDYIILKDTQRLAQALETAY